MKSKFFCLNDRVLYGVFFCYMAILPISSTIALRNIFLLFLFVVFSCLLIIKLYKKINEFPLLSLTSQFPLIVVLWIAFLFLFPLWAVQKDVALINLKGQWITSIFAWLVGFGAVLLLGRRGPGLWALAIASALPLIIHLLLCILAWGGFLNNDFYENPTITSIWNLLGDQSALRKVSTWNWQSFPMGFRGIEPMHGNLGYPACQAIALFSVCLYVAWRDKNKYKIWWAGFLIFLCFLSLFIAESRGAILFAFFVLLLFMLVYFVKCRPTSDFNISIRSISTLKVGVIVVIFILLVSAFQSIKSQERWYSMVDKVKIGLVNENPLDLLCDGIPVSLEDQIRQRFSERDPVYVQALIDGLKGQDGARILLMRAGLDLVLENPRGLDGSRQSYQKLIKDKCGHEPVLYFSHAHQGWIDHALSLGWIGLILYASVMLFFVRKSFQYINNIKTRPWAISLFLISSFWMLRGFADEVYREHYLQMQAVLLAYLFGRMLLELKYVNKDEIN